jgi:hypothetical protein
VTRWNGDAVCLVGLILVASFVTFASIMFLESDDAKLLPKAVAGTLVVLGVIELWRTHFRAGQGEEVNPTHSSSENAEMPYPWSTYLIHFAWIAGFVLALYVFGFLLSLPAFLLSYGRWLRASWRASLLMAILLPTFFYLAFETFLGLPFYRGIIFS